MPYIEEASREACEFDKAVPQTPGELNYAITKLCHRYLKAKGLSYTNGNEVIGVLECAKLELYRVILAPYEDVKREENGPVSELDADFDNGRVEITGSAGPGVTDVTAALIKLLDERLPAPAAAPKTTRKKPNTAAQEPAQPPAPAPATSTTRRPARAVGVSPMTGVAAPEGASVAPASEPVNRKPVAAPKLDPDAKRVSDVWSQAASGNGEEDI